MYVANCIPAPAEVACCISAISIDGHAHLLIGNAWLGLLQLRLYPGLSVYLHDYLEL